MIANPAAADHRLEFTVVAATDVGVAASRLIFGEQRQATDKNFLRNRNDFDHLNAITIAAKLDNFASNPAFRRQIPYFRTGNLFEQHWQRFAGIERAHDSRFEM